MKRSLIFNAIAMVAALGLALWVWTVGDAPKNPKPVVIDWQPGQISHLEYSWPEGHTVVEYDSKTDQASMTLSVQNSVESKESKAKANDTKKTGHEDGGVSEDAGLLKVVAPQQTIKRFPAGRITLQAIKALTPLRARHELGELDDDQLVKLGLDKVERRLRIKGPGGERLIEIGKKSYGGGGLYARLQGQKTVYLLPAKISSGFEGPAGKLMESRILPIKPEKVSAVTLSLGSNSQRYVQRDAAKKSGRYYALADSPENRSDEATELISRLYGLRAQRYLDGPPKADSVNLVATIQVERAEAAALTVKIMERKDGDGYVLSRAPWFAELRGTRVQPLVDDLNALLAQSAQ